jgi:predicted AAA+ superfamily ATPase
MYKAIVLQQKEERDLLLAQEYQKRISDADCYDYLQSPLIKLITGPRRAGKSVFALQLLKNENFAYLNFDDDLLLKNFDENRLLQSLLETYSGFKYLLLDEIQNLPNWDVWVGKLYRRGINLVITGSNAKLLSSEMATALTGRYLQINIFPFSFNEMIDFRKFEIKTGTPVEKAASLLQLTDYMKLGGFPETIRQRSITKNYLGTLFDSILLKDVTKRYNIRNVSELYNIANYLLTNFCNPVSFNQLAGELGLGSTNTAKKFCQYLSEPYLFFYLPRFNSKLKLMQKAPQKVYTIDNGFIFARSFDLSQNLGRLLENLVFTEFLRRGHIAGQTLFYYRSRNDKEIDFICKTGSKITELVQVSYDISVQKTFKAG